MTSPLGPMLLAIVALTTSITDGTAQGFREKLPSALVRAPDCVPFSRDPNPAADAHLFEPTEPQLLLKTPPARFEELQVLDLSGQTPTHSQPIPQWSWPHAPHDQSLAFKSYSPQRSTDEEVRVARWQPARQVDPLVKTPYLFYEAMDGSAPYKSPLRDSFSRSINGGPASPYVDQGFGWAAKLARLSPGLQLPSVESDPETVRKMDELLRRLDPMEMSNGDPPDEPAQPRLGNLLKCGLGFGGVLRPAGVAHNLYRAAPDGSFSFGPCSTYSNDTKDECFLPVVSVIRASEGRTEGPIANHCAGTVVGSRHVLTAAHCVCFNPPYVAFGTAVYPLGRTYDFARDVSSGELNGQIGLLDQTTTETLKRTSVLVRTKGSPSRFRPDLPCDPSKGGVDDVAVLELDLVVPIPRNLIAVLIPTPKRGSVVNLAGFGPDDINNQPAGTKRYVSSTVQSIEDMMEIGSGGLLRDSCRSDSGGGAYVRLRNGRLGITGVLSTGNWKCTIGANSRYVPVAEERYRAFLQQVVPDLHVELVPIYADDPTTCIGANCRQLRMSREFSPAK